LLLLQLASWSAALWTSEGLQVLNLTANLLPDVPAEISYLYNLTHLHLNANRITFVAGELGQLAALDTLELSFNDLEAVPADLAYLAALRVLSLGYNRLSGESLPDLSALAALDQLFLAGNPLQQVPVWLGSLPALSQLHLHLVPLCPFSLSHMLESRPPIRWVAGSDGWKVSSPATPPLLFPFCHPGRGRSV
jgi:Leucine-rich repeat (LRR) protein